MEIYLAITGTYLSISFTIFLYILWSQKKTNIDINKSNRIWKKEVRKNFKELLNK